MKRTKAHLRLKTSLSHLHGMKSLPLLTLSKVDISDVYTGLIKLQKGPNVLFFVVRFSFLQFFALSESLIVRCKHGPPHLSEQLKKFGNPNE